MKLSHLSLQKRIVVQFLLIGLIPLCFMGGVAYYLSAYSLKGAAKVELVTILANKKIAIDNYFETIKNQITTYAQNKMIVEAAVKFKGSFYQQKFASDLSIPEMKEKLSNYYYGDFAKEYSNQNKNNVNLDYMVEGLSDEAIVAQYHYIFANSNPLGSKDSLDAAAINDTYAKEHAEVHPIIRDYLKKFGYYDIFIVDADNGHIIYSVFKELDYGTSLMTGPYAKTNFARVFKKAKLGGKPGSYHFVDFESYRPSYDAPASFIASPIIVNGKTEAVLIFQMPIDRVNAVMAEREGMGETGDAFIVGTDYRMRSDSHLDKKNFSVVNSYRNDVGDRLKTDYIKSAINGDGGVGVFDNHQGVEAFIAYRPFEVFGARWALIAEKSMAEIQKESNLLGWILLVIGLLTGVITSAFGYFVGRGIAQPIEESTNKLKESSYQLSSVSEQLANSSQRMAKTSDNQANAVQGNASAVVEISSMIERTSQQTASVAEKTEFVDKKVKRSTDSMSRLKSSMDEIARSNQSLKEISNVIEDIAGKTTVINDIVFKTQLLAVNASIEAMRAGQQGRGFSVVAEEVGKLAQISGQAASDIRAMIDEGRKKVQEFVETNLRTVSVGESITREVAESFLEIADQVSDIGEQIKGVADAGSEQKIGVNKVKNTFSEIDRGTQQQAQGANRVSDLATNLKDQSMRLNALATSVDHLVSGRKQVLQGESRNDSQSSSDSFPTDKKSMKLKDVKSLFKKVG